MEGIELLVIAGVALAGLVAHRFAINRPRTRWRRRLEGYKPDAGKGGGRRKVCVEGRICGFREALTSPLGRPELAGYQIKVAQLQLSDTGSNFWTKVHEEQQIQDFELDTGRERLNVEAQGCTLLLVPADLVRITDERHISEELRRFLESRSRALVAGAYLHEYYVKWYEQTLRRGDRVSVFGTTREVVDRDGQFSGYRELATRRVLTASGRTPLIISNLGRSDLLALVRANSPNVFKEIFLHDFDDAVDRPLF